MQRRMISLHKIGRRGTSGNSFALRKTFATYGINNKNK
jgi:hypothetical protein